MNELNASSKTADQDDRIPVLHVITRLIVGGAQENTMYTAVMLDSARYCVEVVSGPQTGSEGSLIEEVRARGASLTILPSLLRQIAPLHDLAVLWRLYRQMRARRYVIVHTHSSKAGILGRLAARLAHVPIIVHTVHGWSFHDHMTPWARKVYIWLERWCASFSSALIVVARKDTEKGLREGIGHAQQYHLIRSAIPLDEFDPRKCDREAVRRELGIPLGSPVLGNVGRFSGQKNPLDWVRIASIVGRAMPQCRFLLVGDGPLRAQVEALLRQEGLMERTTLTGLRRDVALLLSAMDVFLLTSRWEGLPRVIPQSLAMEVPVVAYAQDGTVEAVEPGESGYLCPTGDLEGVADYCLQLLRDEDQRRVMGRKGRAFVLREFDIRQMVTDIERLYEQFLSHD